MLAELHQQRLGLASEEEPDVRVIVAMTHQRLDWPRIPEDLAAEMVNEKGFLDIIKAVNPGKPNIDLIETLEGFNTWDEVHLHGGLMNKGDVFELGLGSDIDTIFAQRECEVTGTASHKRGLLAIFDKQPSKALIKIGKKNADVTLAQGACINMHVVGEPKPRQIPWARIDKIVLSKPPAEWNKSG